ncbi:MAG: hypothetical protein J2P26_03955 [Nocardiopsaceae bacterium]|nr:hypothetical protein [Nocardiopsaceae bacterium]
MLAEVALPRPAYALATAKPPTSRSYYVHSGDTGRRAQQFGCEQAKIDNSNGRGSFVILDFGAQRSDGKGTYLPSSTVYWTNTADENYALRFAYGYQSCRPHHVLILAVGTNNDGKVTNGALGAAWGSVVQHIASAASARGYSNVAAQGAIDAEPGYGTFAHFQNWEWGDRTGRGYVGRTKALLDDFGSADGCPQAIGRHSNLRCGNGWRIADEYNAVWGWTPNEATPEIYYDGCHGAANQANQWANISAYGRHHGRKGTVKFVGPLDQGTCLTAARSWTAFQAALTKAGVPQAMKFSDEMVTR